MNRQAIADADGNLIWASGGRRGSTHDTKAASFHACSASTACSPSPTRANKDSTTTWVGIARATAALNHQEQQSG